MNDDHLIIFVKNPFFTNIDKEATDKKHLLPIYLELLHHTASVANNLDVDKHLYYDNYIENDSSFNDKDFDKKIHNSNEPKQQIYDALKEVSITEEGWQHFMISDLESKSCYAKYKEAFKENKSVIIKAKEINRGGNAKYTTKNYITLENFKFNSEDTWMCN